MRPTLAELIPSAAQGDWEAAMARYAALRRLRTRQIQRGSWAANAALHLPDGPAVAARDAKVARFPETFGWIHEFDALRAVRAESG